MSRIGIAFSGGPNPAEIVECVKLAETLGYESAWVAEGHGGDQFATLAACLLSAVLVRFDRCAIVRLRFAVAAAFLMFLRAAFRCRELTIMTPLVVVRSFERNSSA